jgi:squalene-hopene/tetraprenyl-beta-curcumene cyclase
LLEARDAHGHWTGELSSSALSTATAVCALAMVQRRAKAGAADVAAKIARGLDWLAANVNADGGWGDTTFSLSNISTTTLCWAVFGMVPGAEEKYRSVVEGAERWLGQHAGSIVPGPLSAAIIQRYGNDRTFSVPILTMCALAGRLGEGKAAWAQVIQLPFELAVCPPEWFAALRLPVVSYALPALIAMGLARHRHRPTRNPLARLVRNFAEARAMKVLGKIQPGNGGFLEATPLTSFVVMSLAASGYAEHVVARKGMEFLLDSAREDGSWPIDTNLATWLTTLSVNALGQEVPQFLPEAESARIGEWLLRQQFRERHPYTNAPPGGWAWTDLPGGVPDADDTAGALLALRNLGASGEQVREAVWAGIEWLLNLQNSDGGVPTFCRGWGKLPFDQSSADLTAHAMRAWAAWLPELPPGNQQRVRKAMGRAVQYLKSHQEQTGELAGGWKPLWFGNQYRSDEINWTYGTSRVLLALAENVGRGGLEKEAEAAAHFLTRMQLADGSWGGGNGGAKSSVEETALAVEALAGWLEHCGSAISKERAHNVESAVAKGVCWLLDRVEEGTWQRPAPIGFYFAKLWYYERLYPQIFTVGALGRAAGVLKN